VEFLYGHTNSSKRYKLFKGELDPPGRLKSGNFKAVKTLPVP
jgi:hypothetical protein